MGKVPMRPSREDRPDICAARAAQMFSRLDGRKHEKERHEKLCQPLGLYSGLRRLGGRHGQRLGLSEQARQQRRRGIFADLPAVCGHLRHGRPADGIRHRPPRGHGHARRIQGGVGHTRQDRRQGRRHPRLAAAGRLAVHRHRLRRHRDVYPQGAGRLARRHAHDRRRRRVVWRLLLAALFRHPVSHHRRGRHAADAVSRRAQHRKDQQGHDAAVFYHLRGAGRARGAAARLCRGLQVHVHAPLGGAQGSDDLGLGDGSGVFLPVRHRQRHDRLRCVPVQGRGRCGRGAAHGAV